MKSENSNIAASESELLRPDSSEHNPVNAKTERVTHPTLADAVIRHFFPSKAFKSERKVDDRSSPAVASEWKSFLDALNTGHGASLHTPPGESVKALERVRKLEDVRKQIPKRLILAVILFIAAVILGLYSPRPPL